MVDKRTRTSSFDDKRGLLESCLSFVLGRYPKFPLGTTPKVRRAPHDEASLHSEPTGLSASGALRQAVLGTDAATPKRVLRNKANRYR